MMYSITKTDWRTITIEIIFLVFDLGNGSCATYISGDNSCFTIKVLKLNFIIVYSTCHSY